MKLIAGLGNPGEQYKNTFHNLGYLGVEKAAELCGVSHEREFCRAIVADAKVGGEKVFFAKPLTFMNLSGESIAALMNYYKIPLENLIVIYDDYDLPKGSVRIRESGSAGTHNGMRNIVKELGSENFARIRIGFNPGADSKIPLIDYVLAGIPEGDRETIGRAAEIAGKAACDFAHGVGIRDIMQRYNFKAR